jgi:lipopolysaccharide transport system permease protein
LEQTIAALEPQPRTETIPSAEGGASPAAMMSGMPAELPAPTGPSVAASAKPITLIKAQPGWQPVRLEQLWAYRELLYFLVWRDIKVRYKQTVLGAAWAILQPVMTMIVFTIFFGRLGGMNQLIPEHIPYSVFVYSGLLVWTLFSSILNQASMSLVNSGNMISKIYFPRLLIPLSSAGTALVDFVLSLAVMAVLMAWHGLMPPAAVVLLPVFVLGAFVAALGFGMFTAALIVTYRDFRYVIGFVVQLWMFASPIAYPLGEVPARWQLLYALNPMVGMVNGFRACLLGDEFRWDVIAISSAVSLVSLAIGLFYFRQVERRFADII